MLAIEPMLGHRAELRQEVARGLQAVELLPTYSQRAMELRRVLDGVRTAIQSTPVPVPVPVPMPVAAPAPPPAPAPTPLKPLWTRLGGEPTVKAVVHDFVALAASDPQVDFDRGGKFPLDEAGTAHLETLLVQLISAVAGGPLKYEGRVMKPVHQGMAISDAQFDALAGDLVVVLKKYNVPKKESDELLAIIASTRKDIVEAESRLRGR
jgi:hemoglobin